MNQASKLGSVVSEAMKAIQPQVSNKGLSLKIRLPHHPCLVAGDRGRVLQVLLHLLGNAIKFTPKGGALMLDVQDQGETLRFVVTDTGPGIARKHVPNVFKRHWRPYHGIGEIGLGLHVAKSMVKAHGGSIWARSERGKGTAFYFTLPAASSLLPS